MRDLDPNFSPAKFQRRWQEVEQRGRLAFETSHRARNGKPIPVELVLTAFEYQGQQCHVVFARDISQRKEAEEALRKSEERLRQAARVSEIGIFDHDHRTDTIYWSPQQRIIHGWGPDEPVTLPAFMTMIPPEDTEAIAATVRRAHDPASDGKWEIEHRIIRHDGTMRWLRSRSQTFFEGEGAARHPVRTVGAVLDITQRKEAERALQLTQTAIDKANSDIFWVNLAGQLTYANDHACQSLGFPREELLGRYVWDINPDFKQEEWAPYLVELKQDKRITIETRHRRKDGTMFPVEVTGSYVEFEGEVHLLSFVQDITERKRAERALQLTQTTIDNANVAIFWTDTTGKVTYVNDYACQSLGYTREELLGRYPWDFDADFTPEALVPFRAEIEKKGSVQIESQQRRKDGTLFPVEVTASRITFEGEEHVFLFVQDITERKRAEQRLKLVNAAIDKSRTPFYWINPAGRVVYVNESACQSLGYCADELIGMRPWDFDPNFPPEAWDSLWAEVSQKGSVSFEAYHRSKDGTVFPVEVMSDYILFDGEAHAFCFARDISERREAEKHSERLTRLYATLSETNQTIVRVKTADELFSNLTRIAIDFGGLVCAWIGMIDEKTRAVLPISAFGPSSAYTEGLCISCDPNVPEGRGPVGLTLRQGRPQICNDFLNDPTTVPWQPAAEAAGIGSRCVRKERLSAC